LLFGIRIFFLSKYLIMQMYNIFFKIIKKERFFLLCSENFFETLYIKKGCLQRPADKYFAAIQQ